MVYNSCNPSAFECWDTHRPTWLRGSLISHPMVDNSLVNMYSACDKIADADLVFKSMPEKIPFLGHLSSQQESISWPSIWSSEFVRRYAMEIYSLDSTAFKNESISDQKATNEVFDKLAELEVKIEGLRYVVSRNNYLVPAKRRMNMMV